MGSIIIQEMVFGDFSGVSFTQDPAAKAVEDMMIEAVPGGNDALTSGKVVPGRYRLNRDTFTVMLDESGRWQSFIPRDLWPRLGRAFRDIEPAFGSHQDISGRD